jgi:UDP-glucose 4-epimerase
MKTIVIGGAGFIGHHLVKELLKLNKKVVVVDNLSTGLISNIPENVVFYNKDISVDSIEDIIEEGDVVFHLAAKARVQPSIENPIDFDLVNVHGLVKVLTSCKNKKIKRFIFSSSSSVYGDCTEFPTKETNTTNPISPYALQKLIGEQYCELFNKLYDLDVVSLRYFNVYGENMPLEGAYRTLISIFGDQYRKNESFTITNDGEQKRDFTYVNDVVNANILSAFYEGQWGYEVFNVGNGLCYSVNDIVSFFGVDNIKFIGEKIEPKMTLCDNKKIKEKLNWKPIGDIKSWIIKYKESLNL